MSSLYVSIPPLDPDLYTGIQRLLAGVTRTGTVTYDVDYSVPFPEFARWVYVGTSGDLSYIKWDGSTETLPNLVAGVWHPIFSTRINSAGTTIAANQLRWGS